MRTARLITPLVAALLVTATASAAPKLKVPVVVCPRVAEAPALDGRIDPSEWAAAGCLSDFALLGSTDLARLPTRVYLMHTEGSLFVGAQMFDDRSAELVAGVTDRDGTVYEDDSLELFIDTVGQRTDYAHLVTNSLGTKFDAFVRDVSENFEWNVFSAVNETGWAVELELPFDQGIPPLEGETWVLGVCRTAARVEELSTWCRHERGFHEPEAFGEVVFVAPLLSARIDDLGDRLWGDNLALVTVQNLSSLPTTAKVHAVVMGSDRRSHYYGSAKQELQAGGAKQVYLPYKVRRCGPCTLTLSVTDAGGKVAWRSSALPINLPALSDPLDATAHKIATAWKAWAHLAPSETKDALKRSIEDVQKRWDYLDRQVQGLSGAAGPRLFATAVEAQGLSQDAEAVRDRVTQAVEGSAAG